MNQQTRQIATPDWVANAIFYQIFPDRFAKSTSLEKPSNLEPWDSDPTPRGYKGGDLLGVVEHLDHIQDLGFTAIYFTPIFQSASNHRYHTHDYYQVDPLLGGNNAFDTLLAECHRRGLRVVLDGVFNHASRGFFQFNDVLENGTSSPWVDWFTFGTHPANAYDHSLPPGYTAWANLHALPKFNTDNPQVREYLMRIGEYWLRKGIDGWRLDVAAEIESDGFWVEFRDRMKAINPDAYLVAEIWGDASPWLQGDQFDGTMNYLFTEAVIAFTGQQHIDIETVIGRSYAPYPSIDAVRFDAQVQRMFALYPWQINLTQLNLLDSHDTSRLISIVDGDLASIRLATLLLMTFPGAPSVYYGDEIGVTGALPDCWVRKSFPWDHPDTWNRDLLRYHKDVIAFRNAHPTLRTGSFRRVHAEDYVYAFVRELDETSLLIAVNVGDQLATVETPSSAEVVFTTEPGVTADDGRISLPPRTGAVCALRRSGVDSR